MRRGSSAPDPERVLTAVWDRLRPSTPEPDMSLDVALPVDPLVDEAATRAALRSRSE